MFLPELPGDLVIQFCGTKSDKRRGMLERRGFMCNGAPLSTLLSIDAGANSARIVSSRVLVEGGGAERRAGEAVEKKCGLLPFRWRKLQSRKTRGRSAGGGERAEGVSGCERGSGVCFGDFPHGFAPPPKLASSLLF